MKNKEELGEMLVNIFNNNNDPYSTMPKDEQDVVIGIGHMMDVSFGKRLTTNQKEDACNYILHAYCIGSHLKGRLNGDPMKKYIEMKKAQLQENRNENNYQIIEESKLNRLTGKLMQVIEMLPLDEQKQKATKQIMKDYVYDCINDNCAIDRQIFKAMLEDGLPVETNYFN